MSDHERRLFRCLGVFIGRVSLDAITAVVAAVVAGAGTGGRGAGGGKARDAGDEGNAGRTLEGLASLAEKSLVLPGRPQGYDGAPEEPEDDPEPAFGVLETVREYAWERLTQHGELAAARRAHAHYFRALAERAEPQLRRRDQRAWYLRLECEHDNLRAALRWLLDQDGPDGPAEREAGLQLAGALGWFWFARGYSAEGWRWLEEALARALQGEGADFAVRTRALVAAGPLLTVQADFARAQAVLEEALALAQQRQDPAATAEAHTYLGLRAVLAGDVAESARRLQEAVRRWEALGDPHGLGETLFYLGYAADVAVHAAAAAARYTAALQQFGAVGDAQGAGFVHCYLGVVEWRRGDLPDAVAHIQAGVQTSVTLQDRSLLTIGAQATVVLVGARADPAAWARLLGAQDVLAQATGGTFVRERMQTGQDVAGLHERLKQEGWGAAYREARDARCPLARWLPSP